MLDIAQQHQAVTAEKQQSIDPSIINTIPHHSIISPLYVLDSRYRVRVASSQSPAPSIAML